MITRVAWARVRVAGEVVGSIDGGVCALVGVGRGDTQRDAEWLADKVVSARFFRDHEDKMNRSLLDGHGALLAVSQFTLYGDLRRGNRPSFGAAMDPEPARALFDHFRERVLAHGIAVETGRFGASMEVESLNDGPVTLLLDSSKTF